MNRIKKKIIRKLVKYLPYCLYTDKLYAIDRFQKTFGRDLNLKNPKTFNEKIQWLKLYDRNTDFTLQVDKYLVRKYVADKIGEEYLIPIYGVYNNISEIKVSKLPMKFVLKTNHYCGSNIFCKDKGKFDLDKVKMILDSWMNKNYYHIGREWVYKNIEPKIICEQFLEMPDGKELLDYKFFCFNGVPKLVQVTDSQKHRLNTYDMEWNLLPFELVYPNLDYIIKKPTTYNIMYNIAAKLAIDKIFCRIDLYTVKECVYFGEITMYPSNGFGIYTPEEWDYKIGELLTLNKK